METKKDIAARYVMNNPHENTRTIARMLFSDYPKTFTSIENARATVRYVRGAHGSRCRELATDNSLFTPEAMQKLNKPAGFRTFIKPNIIKGVKRLGIITDTHVPYHDEEVLYTLLEAYARKGIDGLYINGDFLDMANESFHEKDHELRSTQDELQTARLILADIRKMFKKIPIWYKMGNHENRLRRFLYRNAYNLIGVPEFKIEALLNFDKFNINVVHDKQKSVYCGMNIFHGHEYRGSGGVNPARWLSLRTRTSSMCGHFHRNSSHLERDANGKNNEYYSIGCTCILEASYAPYNEWSHGGAIIKGLDDDRFQVKLYTFRDGELND